MSKIVGLRRTSFTPKGSDTLIEGTTVYITEPIDPKRGSGVTTDYFFLSKTREANLDFHVSLGQEIAVFYTKSGRLGSVQLISDPNTGVE
ncbi:MAG: hypothetical protein IKB72_01950 [Ruminococcus sp.]|nr:hypothetical protein [Ruminococcus sp.]